MQASSASSPVHPPLAAPRGDRVDAAPVLIFLHNLKTGGTTLRGILGRQYRGDEICVLGRQTDVSTVKREKIDDPGLRLIEGHVPFGVHVLISRPVAYITLLRDPVERIVSLYAFMRNGEGRDIHCEARGALGSLEELVASGALPEVDNGQTRRLAGLSPAYRECSAAMLGRAKENIRHHFAVVGLTERFDESVLLMRRLFGWPSALYSPRKVNPRREPVAALPNSTRRLIEERNRFDRELYEYAAERLGRQVAELGPDFRAELATFSRLNEELARRGECLKQDDRSPRGDDTGPSGADGHHRPIPLRSCSRRTPAR